MKKIPVAVERILKKLGQQVTITWTSRAAGASASTTLTLYVLIEARNVSIGDGKWDLKLVATLPRTERDLNGATLTTQSGKTYNVTTYNQTLAGSETAMQEVILV